MPEFHDMTDILHPVTVGSAQLEVMTVSESFQSLLSGIAPGQYIRLRVDGEIVMSDTPMEHRTNQRFVEDAHGDILIGGLGIGMILLAIQDKPEVDSITVLEKNPDVIQAVYPQLPLNEKVSVVCGDVFTYHPGGRRFDCIYMDIWPFINSDVYFKEMKPLKRRYTRYLKPKTESPDRFVRCWAEYQAKNNRRLI